MLNIFGRVRPLKSLPRGGAMPLNGIGEQHQVLSHFVICLCSVIVMRLKRNAEPMRSFSFSGFNPNGQMAAFTGAAEYPMFANYGPPQSQYNPYNYDGPQAQGGSSYGPQQVTKDTYGPQQAAQDSYGPQPSGVAEQRPAVEPTKKQQPYGGDVNGQESGPKPSGVVPADSKEQINNSAEQADDNSNNIKKQYKGKRLCNN